MASKTTYYDFLLVVAIIFATSYQSDNQTDKTQQNNRLNNDKIPTFYRPFNKTIVQSNDVAVSNVLKRMNFTPKIVGIETHDNAVNYVFDNGEHIERRGGTIAWRNNNPGCIRYSKHIAKMGAVGTANGFAVFPDEETGMRAIKHLLLSEKYRDLNIAAAITRYAPPHENNTDGYIKKLCKLTGLKNTLIIRDLNDEQIRRVVNTIRTIEGWHEGVQTKITPKRTINITEVFAQYDHTRNTRAKLYLEKTL